MFLPSLERRGSGAAEEYVKSIWKADFTYFLSAENKARFGSGRAVAAGKPSFEELTRSSLFPLALQDESSPIIWLSPLLLFPDR
jgi:hypothetical protein